METENLMYFPPGNTDVFLNFKGNSTAVLAGVTSREEHIWKISSL